MKSLTNELWTVGLSELGKGLETPLSGLDLPVMGQESASIGSPNKSYCMEELANGGVQIVNPPDCDDDRMEARR